MVETRLRNGKDSVGKMDLLKFGILPITVGPKRIPPMTSAMTRGCLILPKKIERSWVMPTMRTADPTGVNYTVSFENTSQCIPS